MKIMKEGEYDPVKLTEVRLCKQCSSQSISEKFCGDEGWSVCENCGAIEGGSKYVYEDERGYYQCGGSCGRRWTDIESALKCNCKKMKFEYCKKCLTVTPKDNSGVCKICKK